MMRNSSASVVQGKGVGSSNVSQNDVDNVSTPVHNVDLLKKDKNTIDNASYNSDFVDNNT